MQEKNSVSRKVESDLLLNIKDIEKIKSSNAAAKFSDVAMQIDTELEKYNKEYIKALQAPIPNISLHANQILTRAVPLEVKSKGGIILSVNDTDMAIAKKLKRMSHAVYFHQEILLVGAFITEEMQKQGLRPGRMCKFGIGRFRTLTDEHLPGMIETEFEVPREIIDGYPYLILDKNDIIYTYDKK